MSEALVEDQPADEFERRVCTPEDALEATRPVERPAGPAPSKDAPLSERIFWSEQFVRWAFPADLLDAPHPESGVHGHLWRIELSACMADPEQYERLIDEARKREMENT